MLLKVSARNVKKVLSELVGYEMKHKASIEQTTAEVLGFRSFQRIEKLHDRSGRILESVWAERRADERNQWTVLALNARFVVDTQERVIYRNDGAHRVNCVTLPESLSGYQFAESDVDYCDTSNEVSFRAASGASLVFHRTSDHELSITVTDDASAEKRGAVYTVCFDDDDFDAVEIWLNDRIQLPRLLSECVMICEDDSVVKTAAARHGFSVQQMQAACDTAMWLFEREKGDDAHIIDGVEPEEKFEAAIGFFAHLFLEHYYAKDKKATQELMESTDFTQQLLSDSKARAKAAADWFLFSYCG